MWTQTFQLPIISSNEMYICQFFRTPDSFLQTNIQVMNLSSTIPYHHVALHHCDANARIRKGPFDCTSVALVEGCHDIAYLAPSMYKKSHHIGGASIFKPSRTMLFQFHKVAQTNESVVAAKVSMLFEKTLDKSLQYFKLGPTRMRFTKFVSGTCPSSCRKNWSDLIIHGYALHMHDHGLQSCIRIGETQICHRSASIDRMFKVVPFKATRDSGMGLNCTFSRQSLVPGSLRTQEMCFAYVLVQTDMFEQPSHCWQDEYQYSCETF